MVKARRSSGAPWITAGVIGVVLAALLVVFFAVLLPARDTNNPGALTSAERAAVSGATTDAVNVLSYSRANFEADYQRALAGVTGNLLSDLKTKKAATLQTITAGKFDLIAKANHAAFSGALDKSGKSYVVLVAVLGYKSSDPTMPLLQNLKVTVTKLNSKWLASDITQVQVN